MRILLVYPGITYNEQPINIMYISAVLKREGHQVDFLQPKPNNWLKFFGSHRLFMEEFREKLLRFKPDLIGFSVMTVNYRLSSILSCLAKELLNDVTILWGGIHPTVDPEGTIVETAVDMICVGEGEEAVKELVANIVSGKDINSIDNIWVRRGDVVYRNPVRPLSKDLDILPNADREIYASRYESDVKTASFITSRGCPFHCSYCQNEFLQELYKGKGKFVRYRAIDTVIDEIQSVVSNYKIEKIVFSDEMFTLNKQRMIDFCEAYKKEIGLPFICQTRPSHVDEEALTILKEAGCEEVNMAVEAGNDHQRNVILKRNMSRETIVNAFMTAKKIGLQTGSLNMIGIPDETEATIWDTIHINKEIQPDMIACTIFLPFKGTRIGDLFEQKGWIKEDPKKTSDYYSHVATEISTISSNKLLAYEMLFRLYVRTPERFYWFLNIIRIMIEQIPVRKPRSLAWLLKGLFRRLIAFIGKTFNNVGLIEKQGKT